MLTRTLFLTTGWFVLSFAGLLIWGARSRTRSPFVSVLWLAFVILAGDAWAYLTFGVPREILIMSLVAGGLGLIVITVLPDWNPFGKVLWAISLLTTFLFVVYSFAVTAFTTLNPLSYLIAVIFFFIEAVALLLALTHTYESLDSTTRVRWRRRMDRPFRAIEGYAPMISLHVPAYNEPVSVVRRTLDSLANLDYPNYEVLVIDNNTPDEAVWRKLEKVVRSYGARFKYVHLDQWPGFKSGALNFALAQTDPDAEIIGVVDADYEIDRRFLRDLVPGFHDPQLAFIQTPQDFRDWEGHAFTRATYYSYKYFFEVSMPARNEHNAIIVAGTMGLIRKTVLQEIGGWDEWCITEDAEASLRILKRGYRSIYLNKSYGTGLIPFTFDGLKKQRFRWCFGGIQILKKHWDALMPWARLIDPQNRLTISQRYFYLAGGLQWYSDVLNLVFAFFLVTGALFSYFDVRNVVRPLTGPLIVLPGVFLFLNIWRFLWVLRHKLRLTWQMALFSMYNFFSLGWVVTLASIQGIFQPEGVFLRTSKAASKRKFWRAIFAARWETGIGLICLASGTAAFIDRPDLLTFLLAALLYWQGSLYLSAPLYSLLALGVKPPEEQRLERPGRIGVRENRAARFAIGLGLVVALIGLAVQFLPPTDLSPFYSIFRPPSVPIERLFGGDPVPIEERDDTPTPTLIPSATPIAPTETPLPAATSTPTAGATSPPPTSTFAPPPTGTSDPPPTGTSIPPPTGTSDPPPTGTSLPPPTSTGPAPTPTPVP